MKSPTSIHRLLIVDDNREIHKDFRKILCANTNERSKLDDEETYLFNESSGSRCPLPEYELESAYQGQEALELVQRAVNAHSPYSMAFVDVRMPPGWDGIETITRLWEVDPNLQVVICTAYSDYSWDDMMVKLGHTDRLVILKKPFDNIEVLQLANAMTEKWRLRQQTQAAMENLEQNVAARTAEVVREQAKFRVIFENSPEGIFQSAADGTLLCANSALATILGYDSAAELMEHVSNLGDQLYADPRRRAEFRRQLEQHHSIRDFEAEMICKDGSHKWTSLAASRTASAQESTFYYNGLIFDISAQKRAEQERNGMEIHLRQAQKLEAIGQLAAGIAHEINTPTQYVGDNTRFLKDAFDTVIRLLHSHGELLAAAKQNAITPELLKRVEETLVAADVEYLFQQVPQAIQETLEGVERVATIVRAMKEFSHPGGKEKSASDLNKAIESTTTVARNEWKYVSDLKLDLAPDLPLVPCFIGEFNQAILNLVVNAAHAIGDVVKQNPGAKGTITIQTRRDGDHVEVRVSDTGTGIAEANRCHIFEPFFTTKDVGKGTGQGLNLVYSTVVKKHGGTATFESEVGKGTTFVLRLPINPQSPATEKPTAGELAETVSNP